LPPPLRYAVVGAAILGVVGGVAGLVIGLIVHPATAWFADEVVPVREVWVEERAPDGVVALLVLDGDWVDQLYVDPPWFGQRIGSGLLDLAEQRRPDGLQLLVFATNVAAQRFYERHGFVAVETTEGDNEEGAPDVRYRWTSSRTASS